jgi:RNA polymerase sigma-70 factor (ECF subfamily)
MTSELAVTDEGGLLASLRLGDEAAFASLTRAHGGRMLATARRLLRNDDDAEDVVQDAFIAAARGIHSFAGEARLSTWLHRIVVNAALMKLRGRRRRPEVPIDALLPSFDVDGHRLDARSAWETPSDELLERAETRAKVRACIARLPEGYRAVLLLRDIEELDTQETAAALGLTPNAVKIRLHRARQALRTLLERELDATGNAGDVDATAAALGS